MSYWVAELCPESGSPKISVKLFGLSEDHFVQVEAIVDTGFSGFVSMPLVTALPLGLSLVGTTQYQLADGNPLSSLTAIGTARVDGRSRTGIFSLHQAGSGGGVLLGMQFLREMEVSLFVLPALAALVDNSIVQTALNEAARVAAERRDGGTS